MFCKKMPKEITHWAIAEKIYQHLPDGSHLKQLIRQHKNLYLIGAVLPDTPFYLIYGKHGKMMNRIGEEMHDNPADSYVPLAEAIRCYEPHIPDDVLALFLGIISHIHADSVFHPCVYYFSGISDHPDGRKKAVARHHTLETFLDICYMRDYAGRLMFYELLNHAEISAERLLDAASRIFSGFHKAQRCDEFREAIQKAFRAHSFIQNLFDKDSLKIILDLLNRIPVKNADLCMSYFYPYRKPEPVSIFVRPFSYHHPVTGEACCHTVKELEGKAVQDALNIFRIAELQVCNRLSDNIFSCVKGPNLYTGMAGTRKSDMRYFSTRKDMMELIFR
jgi:hypothetical protein